MLDSPPRSGGCDVRVLFVSDTHIGLDWPTRPRVVRHRRGDDFFQNFERALEPARTGAVDVVVHGGDLLYGRYSKLSFSKASELVRDGALNPHC
jgi:3',5'-cyclic AMP phosphodiesterase CpdA